MAKTDIRIGDLDQLLQRLAKKPVLTTLAKSKLDWKRFTRDPEMQNELLQHSKNSFLERHDFQQRANAMEEIASREMYRMRSLT